MSLPVRSSQLCLNHLRNAAFGRICASLIRNSAPLARVFTSLPRRSSSSNNYSSSERSFHSSSSLAAWQWKDGEPSRAEKIISSPSLGCDPLSVSLVSNDSLRFSSTSSLAIFVTEEMLKGNIAGIGAAVGVSADIGNIIKEQFASNVIEDLLNPSCTSAVVYSSTTGPINRLFLINVGKKDKFTIASLRSATTKTMQLLQKYKITDGALLYPSFPVLSAPPQAGTNAALSKDKNSPPTFAKDNEILDAITRVSILTNHFFDKYLSLTNEDSSSNDSSSSSSNNGKKKNHSLKSLRIVRNSSNIDGVHQIQTASAIAECTILARELANDRADSITPESMETLSRSLVNSHKNELKITVLDENQLKAEGYHLITAVGQAAKHKARIIAIEYNGAGADNEKIALIGKGITFDSGGLNLKPTGSMEDMHMDMSGSAAVLSTMKALAITKPRVNVIGVLALAENAIDALSYKPHQIIKSAKGSVEISNTDAEGRLALADAFTYVQKTYSPHTLIDLATLTGACVVALGEYSAGLFSNNEALAASIIDSGARVHERCWRLPIFQEHSAELKGKYSDMRSTGAGRWGGACTAAAFLQKFVDDDVHWAHIDIAGPAMYSKPREWMCEGGTGYGVQLLMDYLSKH